MTEIASPSPTHALPPATNGDNNGHHHHDEPSTIQNEPVDLDLDSPETRDSSSGISEFEDDEQVLAKLDQIKQNAINHAPKTNGIDHAYDTPTTDDGPPAKRRRVRDTTPNNAIRKPKVESPPWKKVEAEGPTRFVAEDGRRKSGRINTLPLELQPGDKRITRGKIQASPPRKGRGQANCTGSANSSTPASGGASKRPTPAGKHATSKAAASKPLSRKSLTQEVRSSARGRRRSTSPKRPTTPTKQSLGTRRSTRRLRDNDDDGDSTSPGATRTTPRIKLRRPPLTELPLVHWDQANLRPKLGPSFEEYIVRAANIPVEEGGLLIAAEDGPRYTDKLVQDDASIILRIEKEVEPGGLLAEERCSIFEPEAEEEPPRQWAHLDHMTKAMSNFRKLMLMEQQRHRATAKRIAIACEGEWRRRNPQPKTAEEIEFEEREKSKARWRQVGKAIVGTWENVKAEVNRRRLVEWEAEEQRRVKAALNQAVNLSEQKLQARQTQYDVEELLEEDEDEDEDMDSDMDDEDDDSENAGSDNGSEADDESNMSSSEDEDDKESVLSDEGLTQEQLREKYANLPVLESKEVDDSKMDDGTTPADTPQGGPTDMDTSDESVDMDDDLGATEEESDDDEVEEEDSDESDEEPAGLLSLFFKKSELKKLEVEAAPEGTPAEAGEDVKMAETDPSAVTAQAAEVDTEMPDSKELISEPVVSTAEGRDPLGGASSDAQEQKPGSPQAIVAIKYPLPQVDGTATESPAPLLPLPVPTDAQSADEAATATHQAHPVASDVKSEELVDIPMVDAPTVQESSATHPTALGQHHSPATEPITNAPSLSRSQSPRTSDDTKPTDAETPASTSQLNVAKSDSRELSPQQDTPRTEIPFLLRGTLREYQHHGLDWLAALYANNTNGILADEMGLGKTIQTIALLAHLACHHEVWGPHLVIVPTSVMLNWEMEFKKWCPGFKILTYYGNQEERKRKRQGWTNDDVWNVCITSYQMVLQDQQVFRRRRWHYMILDEAHNIKNFKSQRWQTLLGFNTHARLLLTGTPLQNNLTELWSLLYFLAPPENGEGGFVDLREFHNWFSRPESQILESGREQLDDEARAIISKLHKVLRPYLLRRLKADVEKQMPAKYEHVEFCRLSKRQRELYDGFLSRADTRETLSSGNYMSIINCLMQLRKVCNHPDLFVDRPIMTSFRMQRSVAADYEINERVVRKKLLAEKLMSTVSLSFLNMIPTQYEDMSTSHADRIAQLSTLRIFPDLRDAQKVRASNAYHNLDPASVKSNIVYLESAARWGRFEELQHCVYLNALRRQQRPIYGKRLVELLTLDTHRRPYKQRPKVPQKVMGWFEEDLHFLHSAIPTLQQRAESMETTITKFACVTPAVVTGDLNKFLLGEKGIQAFEEADLRLSAPVKYAPYMPKERPADPWHEARMRLSIQFPDKRLLQYDCGKLQALDKLLRKLQAGGHRALVFTQMTKVLDILEQFLNIHGHKYLRLDGATKVEQRQILTDRFNHDTRITCFILSTRSGGLGINLTGADTVIFYDQDWNPAMDKQCQDRAHRIGQTRDVHIYRLVSEHTIEANILRKASQKQMLDDVVIQEGEFTTDYFNKISVRDVITTSGEICANENDVAANAAMDRVLGGVESTNPRNVGRVLEQAEDKEDVAAARVAEKEIQEDEADFLEQQPSGVSSARNGTPREGTEPPVSAMAKPSGLGLFAESAADGVEIVEEDKEIEYNAWGERIQTIDDYMLKFMTVALEGTPLDLPKDKKKSKKKGKDTRKR